MTLELAGKRSVTDFLNPAQYALWLRKHSEGDDYESAEVEEVAAEAGVLQSILRPLQGHARHYPSPPLLAPQEEIRLLHLSPGAWNDRIACTLTAVTLASNPQYAALSYTWGGSQDKKTIRLKGVDGFPVTDNLEAALRRLRNHDTERILWVDSICINQSDLRERGQQVSIMGRIYREASCVIVWLGDYGIDAVGEDETFGMELDTQGAMDAIFWNARPRWWERSWIVQEVVHAANIDVYFGPFHKPWPVFCWEVLGLTSIGGKADTTKREPIDQMRTKRWSRSGMRQEVVSRFDLIDVMRFENSRAIQSGGVLHLDFVIRNTKDQQCSDGRDKVYSILSLAAPEVFRHVQPDYTRPIDEVFARATYGAIVTQGTFAILLLRRFWQDVMTPLSARTWAVDFLRVNSFDHRAFDNDDDFTHTARWPGQRLKCHDTVSLSADAGCLTAEGVRFDMVASCYRVHSEPGGRAETGLIAFLESALHSASQKPFYAGIGGRPSGGLPTATQHGTRIESSTIPSCSKMFDKSKHMTVQSILLSAFNLWNKTTQVPEDLLQRAAVLMSSRTEINSFWAYAKSAAFDVQVFTTSAGFIGLAPGSLAVGDSIALLHGSQLPVIVRPCDANHEYGRKHHPPGQHWTFWGFAYMHGIMNRELLHFLKDGDLAETAFCLT